MILERQLGQLRCHFFLLGSSDIWQIQPWQALIMRCNKSTPLPKLFEKRCVLLLAPQPGAYPIFSPHPGANYRGSHIPSTAGETPRRVREHSFHIIVRPHNERDIVHLSRQFLPSLQRCWSYRHRNAILVKDVTAILVNQDEPLNILAQGELRCLQHGLAAAQEFGKLTWHKIR